MAVHESPRTTELYDRAKERLIQVQVERIRLWLKDINVMVNKERITLVPDPEPHAKIRTLVATLQRIGVEPRVLQKVMTLLHPDHRDPGHWAELAALLRRMGNYEASRLMYETALSILRDSALLWNNFGVLLREWGKSGEAVEAFDKAIAINPSYPSPLENKGRTYEIAHRFVEARALYEAALKLRPDNARVANNIGACLMGEGEPDQAEAWFERSLQLDPKCTDALFNLAALYLENDMSGPAGRLIDRLSQELPNDPEIMTLRDRLESTHNVTDRKVLKLPPVRRLIQGKPRTHVEKYCDQLSENPRSVFISYAWTDPETKIFARKLSKYLKENSFQVFLDVEHDLEVHEVLTILSACQNVVVLNDQHYAESCLLGKVPVAQPTSRYPSFAFPASRSESKDYVEGIFKISAVTWLVAKTLIGSEAGFASKFAFDLATPTKFGNLPDLRVFVEGWRVDEIQIVFSNLRSYRSISVLYLGGEHCLGGYPLLDCSNERYHSDSFEALVNVLNLSVGALSGHGPKGSGKPSWETHPWQDSAIVEAKMWRISGENAIVWRPSLLPSGDAAAIINHFREWVAL
jgi:Tfp pilus assembly protein PilF